MFLPSHRWRKQSLASVWHSWNTGPSLGLPSPHRKSHESLPSWSGAEEHAIWGETGAVGSVHPGEEKVSGWSNCCLQLPIKREDKATLFPEACKDRTRGNRHCLKHMKIWRVLIQEGFFWSTVRLVKHWKRLPRWAMGPLSLEVFKIKPDTALCNLIWIDHLRVEGGSRELLRSLPIYVVVWWPDSLSPFFPMYPMCSSMQYPSVEKMRLTYGISSYRLGVRLYIKFSQVVWNVGLLCLIWHFNYWALG